MKTTLIALAIALGASSLACAGLRAAQARQAYIADATQAHKYSQSCTEIWGSARTMLFGQNYEVKSADAVAGLTLETDWRSEDSGASSRYLFQGQEPAEGTCQVTATRAFRDAQGNTSMDRDWEMEWNLLRQVDITAAQAIEAEADAAGNAAR